LTTLRSRAGIDRAVATRRAPGVSVDFRAADATTLEGFEVRFDTVIYSAVCHVFLDDEHTQTRYVRALHRATRAAVHVEFERQSVTRPCRGWQ
jgi:hypothetical protein